MFQPCSQSFGDRVVFWKKHMNIARIISNTFNPLFTFLGTFILIAWKTQELLWMIGLIVLLIGPVVFLKRKYDLPDGHLAVVVMVVFAVVLPVLYFFGNRMLFNYIAVMFSAMLLVTVLTTTISVVSGHVMGAVVLAVICFTISVPLGALTLALVGMVCWSRLYLGKHSITEIALALSGFVPMVICVYYFGMMG